MNWKKTLFISIAILLAGGAVTAFIFLTEPTAERGGATRETAMLVEVVPAKRGTFRPTIVATGTVRPAEDVLLSPRVGGQVIRRSPAFVPGGFVRKGQTLLQIDPADYRNTLQLRESGLRQAEANLEIERGRQEVARKDYQLVGETLSQENKALVLRQPQFSAAQAQVEAAQAAARQAELELERTAIKAPFDAHVLSRNANVGSQVAPGDNLGRLVGVDQYWVEATVPLAQLRRLSFPGPGRNRGSEVKIRSRTAWPEGIYRTGYLYKLIGALEGQTRLARVLATVPDPLAYQNDSLPPLMIGAFVETRIRANELSGVIRLNRDHLRENETVWVMEEGKLRIREVDIAFRDAQYAYISSGLNEGDQVVTTNLSTVADGAPLRAAGPEDSAGQDTLPATALEEQAGMPSS
ncbi:MAG: efflux RND transporter periplasmic adaptor subunit [Phaeodactylibacter sp.]|nr:efflux RND transporter periplasmic adaptor subunit [Phaeodactylibacter sp.]